MTQFWKEGHTRTNAHGKTFWVEGHWVERTDWSRWSYSPPPLKPKRSQFLERFPEFEETRSVAACFVNPNARCPVCGDIVFYYENEHGSRVFFDELGPPWPKHPCTDTRSKPKFYDPQSDWDFDIRTPSAITAISRWKNNRGYDFEAEFREQYGVRPWLLATIEKRIKAVKNVFLILKQLKEGRAKYLYVSCKSLPKCCSSGFLVAIRSQEISFIDTATMTSKDVAIKRYRGAKPFIDAMVQSDK